MQRKEGCVAGLRCCRCSAPCCLLSAVAGKGMYICEVEEGESASNATNEVHITLYH